MMKRTLLLWRSKNVKTKQNPNATKEIEIQAGEAEMFQCPDSPQILATERQNNLRKYRIILETGHNADAMMATV